MLHVIVNHLFTHHVDSLGIDTDKSHVDLRGFYEFVSCGQETPQAFISASPATRPNVPSNTTTWRLVPDNVT